MVISYNSQLGLRFKEGLVKLGFVQAMRAHLQSEADASEQMMNALIKYAEDESQLSESEKELINSHLHDDIPQLKENELISQRIRKQFSREQLTMAEDGISHYFICESVYKAAELIKINEKFTGRTLKDIKFGKYSYLMGKHRMIRFECGVGAISGFYYDDEHSIAFEFGVDISEGGYFFPENYSKEFTMLMQILAFVELGDIEVKMLPAGRNNGGKKNIDKVTNTSNNTVYVVDSSWNQIIIRTEGFAVRGHFRLQPCGEQHKDRKLIWVDAFEKHGYKRRPSAEIVQ